jgi:peptidylamidoglycolate lyase
MVRKTLIILLLAALVVALAFVFQPLRKGKGLNKNVHYELVPDWPQLPGNLRLGNPTGLGFDTSQNLVVFHRAGREWPLLGGMPKEPIREKTVLILDKAKGQVIQSWGNNLFIMPHGLTVDRHDNIWVTDVGLHQVFKFSHNGKLLLTLGEAGIPGKDTAHFNKPTDVAIAKDGSVYISDGYVNSRIMLFDASGKFLKEWGEKGKREGEFDIPHALSLDTVGNVFVADRENNRIQVFDPNGRFIKQYSHHSYGAMVSIFHNGFNDLFAVDDLTFLKLKHRGSDIYIFDNSGKVQTRFGRSGNDDGAVSWHHDLAVDREGSIYVGDILGNRILKFRKIQKRK